MRNSHLYRVLAITALGILVLLGTFAGVSRDAIAQDSDSESSLAQTNAPAVTPPPLDALWVQVQSCIEYAMTNGKLNQILPYSATQLCAYVDAPMSTDHYIGAGYTVLKDKDVKNKPAAFLTLPSKIVYGIEDAQVTFFAGKSSFSDSYFAAAWGQFGETVDALYSKSHQGKHLKPTQEGMAVNSIASRGLNQLHIHMACVLPAVQAALAKAKIGSTWSAQPITLPPNSHPYYAINISGSLVANNPFLEMQSEPHFKKSKPGDQTLVVTGAPSGFYVLLDYVAGKDTAMGEELLDQFCKQ
jgi:CDP-diacylglycerol pyrophosphatase